MKKLGIAAALAATLMSSAAWAGEVRVLWYSDGVEGEVVADLLKRFEAANPDVKITLDNVAYNVIRDQLPVQLEAGNGPDIARELVVSLNTVRTHTKNIYAKLGVNSRRAAVRRARELRL